MKKDFTHLQPPFDQHAYDKHGWLYKYNKSKETYAPRQPVRERVGAQPLTINKHFYFIVQHECKNYVFTQHDRQIKEKQ